MSMALGILGGMFDPVHNGHMAMARVAIDVLGLDQVRMIPCGIPPHREPARCTAQQRVDMLTLACRNDEGIVVDEREIDRPGKSFAFDTLTGVRNEFKNEKLYYLLGADALLSLPEWYRWHDLFDLCHIVAFQRPGFSLKESNTLQEEIQHRLTDLPGQLQTADYGLVLICNSFSIDVSSSQVRQRIEAQLPLDGMVDPVVIDYICERGLFSMSTK